MKKFLTVILFVFVLEASSFGAVSEDMNVYVRQDVFDAKMETLFFRLHSEIENLGTRLEGKIDALSAEMNGKIDALSKRIDGIDKRIDGLDKRIDDTNTFLYYFIVLFVALIALPYVNKWFETRKEKKLRCRLLLMT